MDTDWEAKLHALLHDPPHKAVCLSQRVGHEAEASRLQQAVGVARAPFRREADHIASAADRPRGLEDAQVDWLAAPEVMRPLGGRAEWLDAELRAAVASLDARALTDDLIASLSRYAGLPPRERFLAVWGLLPEELLRGGMAIGGARLGPVWGVLPADTRVPDHSIWSHAGVVSAFQGALPEPALLQLWFGPVQPFIASSRRTRDLWGASWLLSYLVGKAAWWLSLEIGPDAVVFPDLRGHPLIDLWLRRHLARLLAEPPDAPGLPAFASLPNRLVVIAPAARLRELGAGASDAARRGYVTLVENLRAQVEPVAADIRPGEHDEAWSMHWRGVAEGFPETAWAAVRLPADPGEAGLHQLLHRARTWAGADGVVSFIEGSLKEGRYRPNMGLGYPAAYRLAQRALGDRKPLRAWAQWEAPGERCTVCGERPALPLVSETASRGEQRRAWGGFAARAQRALGMVVVALDGREMVCGVCLVRRALPRLVGGAEGARWERDGPWFPSTGSVATALWRRAVEGSADDAIRARVVELAGIAARAGADREPRLYEGRAEGLSRLDGRILLCGAEQLQPEYGEHAAGLARAAEALRAAIRHARRGQEVWTGEELGAASTSPPSYYAVLAMDGDEVGRWLSGDHAVRLDGVVHASLRGAGGIAPLGPSRHAGLSAALRGFATWGAPAIVSQACGALIYAGGDDVLALLPVGSVLDAARRLRVGFSQGGVGDGRRFAAIPGEARSPGPASGLRYWLGAGGDMTASTGIAIAHHMADLRTVVEAARAIEERAKREGRDALGVAVLKRSGERREGVWPWFLGDGGGTSAEVMGRWREAFRSPLSRRIIADLAAERAVAELGRADALERRLRLLLRRHHTPEGQRTEDVDALARGLLDVAAAGAARGWGWTKAWSEALALVDIAAFLARGGVE